MIDIIQPIVSLIVTLGILVTVHEYGHYWVARRCGVKVLRFSVGFGKPLYTWKNKAGTEFCVASIPLGGYVKMLDEREAEVCTDELQYAFNRQSVSKRIAIAVAGPVANFLFAICAYWLMFCIGYSTLIPTIGAVEPSSIADNAGLVSGHEIVAIDGREVAGWREVSVALVNFIGEDGHIPVKARKGTLGSVQSYDLDINQWMLANDQSNLLSSLGIDIYRPPVPAVMGEVLPDSAAADGGLKKGDSIVSIDGIAIKDWFDFVSRVKVSPEKELLVEVARMSPSGSTNTILLPLKPRTHITEQGESVGRLGVGVAPYKIPADLIRTVQHGSITSISYALDQTWADVSLTLGAIRKMAVGLMSLDNLSGPITIAQVASESISSGLEEFLRLLALLSISLGVLNLLPIPVLDGGHILFYTIEAVFGKPLPESWQLIGLKIGISFVFVLMAIAFYNDVMRL